MFAAIELGDTSARYALSGAGGEACPSRARCRSKGEEKAKVSLDAQLDGRGNASGQDHPAALLDARISARAVSSADGRARSHRALGERSMCMPW